MQGINITTLGKLNAGDVFVFDLDDVHTPEERSVFKSFAYDGYAMIADPETGRAFKSGHKADSPVIQLVNHF